MFTRTRRPGLFLASALSLGCLSGAALAQDSSSQLNSIEKQIRALQAELHRLKAEAAQRDRELRAARAAPAPVKVAPVMPNIPAGYALVPAAPGSTPGSVVLSHVELPSEKKLPQGAFQVGGVTVTFGGFLEGASIFRSRNEVTDVTSNYTTGIPLRNSQLYHEPEFGESARRTTVQALADAKPDEVTDIEAFVQNDFQGGAPTSNENQSNAFIPRLVQAWAEYTRSDLGLTILAGQSWSLLTMTQVGINPLRVNNPQTIDGNYVPGFTWTRQPQFRIGKSFDNDTYWLALSIENPQTVYANTGSPSSIGTVNFSNPGIGSLGTASNSATTVVSTVTATTGKSGAVTSVTTTTANVASQAAYTNNFAPDIIVKGTADYPFAHLEAYGLARVFNDRVSTLGHGVSDTVWGGGGGADALVHVIPHYLDFQVSGLAGQGIGRYGTSQLPDATIGPNGQPVPLREWAALAGLLGHPTPQLDVYSFFGTEQGTQSAYYNTITKGVIKAFGYANPRYLNTSCDVELGASADCTGTTKATVQGTIGAWWKFLKGSYGTMQVGAQYSYTRRFAWQGVGPTPQSDENMLFLSLRYYPFQ
jgi:hypothetical protein